MIRASFSSTYRCKANGRPIIGVHVKAAIFGFVLVLGFGRMAMAMDPAINCLQWRVSTERSHVTKANSTQFAKSVLADLSQFGFRLEATSANRQTRTYLLRYNRDGVLQNARTLRDYEQAIFQLSRSVHSRLGYAFECAFAAPEPRPRVSGSSSK